MKDYLIQLIHSNPNTSLHRSLAREYLQARILDSLQKSGAMIPLAFQGGTALRFLYNNARFSEDLDFALERPSAGYDLSTYLKNIKAEFTAEAYNVQIKVNDQRAVHSAFVRIYGLLYELKLSSQETEALSVKIEVDTKPPAGANLETDLVRHHFTLRIQHHDRASLLAGKLHAILQRDYAKGRDLYDLMWYLSDTSWPEPNLILLGNALEQTKYQGSPLTPETWRARIYDRLKSLDWKAAVDDVRPFLERPEETEYLTIDNFARLLHQ